MWFPDRLRATLWRCRVIVWIAACLVPRAARSHGDLSSNASSGTGATSCLSRGS